MKQYDYHQMTLKCGEYDPKKDVFARQSIGGDEYYTLPQTVLDIIEQLKPIDGVVWCPFDKPESQFVIQLKEHGFNVVNTHIDTDGNFFEIEPPENCKAIISNPPFTLKKEVLKRIKSLDIPFVLILPHLWMNDGVPFDYGDQLIFWRKRVKFMQPNGKINTPRTTCFVLSNGLLKNNLKIYHDR